MSREILILMMKIFLPSPTLERMSKRTTKLLTLELELETLAEFSAAAEVFGARSKSTFLNQYVVQKIREAKQTVSKDEFSAVYNKHLEAIQERSERKSKERNNSTAKVNLKADAEKTETKKIEAVPLEELIAERGKAGSQKKTGKKASHAEFSEPVKIGKTITLEDIQKRKVREPSNKD
jgi:hypothetical protein